MNAGPPLISSGTFLVRPVPQRIDVIRRETTVLGRCGSIEDEWGRSESLDPDNVGDIADEGAGHRG
jgi:hypothetical protein